MTPPGPPDGQRTARRGRPPDEKARARVLAAAGHLLDEVGYRAMTVDELALRAEVSKKTVYRWWPNKAAIVTDVMIARSPIYPVPDAGNTRAELHTLFDLTFTYIEGGYASAAPFLAEVSQDDPELATKLRNQVVSPRRDIARGVVQRGIARGDLPADIDIDTLLDLWIGLVQFRTITRPAPVPSHTVDQLIELAMNGHVPRLGLPG